MSDQANTTSDTQPLGDVSKDEIKAVLAGRHPKEVGPTKMRKLLGNRGSMSTITKALKELAAEAEGSMQVPPDAAVAPPPPQEEWRGVWNLAYNVALSRVLTRTEQLASQRDEAVARAEAAESNVEQLSEEFDRAMKERDQALADLAGERIAFEAARQAAEAARLAATDVQAADRAEIGRLNQQIAQERREREIEKLTLQSQIDRLHERLTERINDAQALLASIGQPGMQAVVPAKGNGSSKGNGASDSHA